MCSDNADPNLLIVAYVTSIFSVVKNGFVLWAGATKHNMSLLGYTKYMMRSGRGELPHVHDLRTGACRSASFSGIDLTLTQVRSFVQAPARVWLLH